MTMMLFDELFQSLDIDLYILKFFNNKKKVSTNCGNNRPLSDEYWMNLASTDRLEKRVSREGFRKKQY